MTSAPELCSVRTLLFAALSDGSPLAVESKFVVRYVPAPPPIVRQPGSRLGVVGIASLAGTSSDMAVVDVPWALGLERSPAAYSSAPPLLVVREERRGREEGIHLALATGLGNRAATMAPPQFDLCDVRPVTQWDQHPHLGGILRRSPIADMGGSFPWLLDPGIFTARLRGQ